MTSSTATRPDTPSTRMSPTARRALLTLHLASGVGLIGVDLVLVALGAAGLRDAEPGTVYPAMALVARAVLVPLAVTALATGVLQAYLLGYGLLRRGWVTAKLVITSLLTIAAVLVVVPGLGRAAEAATSAGQQVTDSQQVVSTVTPAVAAVLLLTAAVLGVFRPGRGYRR